MAQLRNFHQARCFSRRYGSASTEGMVSVDPAWLDRILRHVERRLDEPLGLDDLSAVAGLSKYHFHRQFSARVGFGIGEYIRLLRLKRASYRLAFRRDDPVTAIALDSGYESPEAFARAFKHLTGQTPTEFREAPNWPDWNHLFDPLRAKRISRMTRSPSPESVRIIQFPDTPVAVMVHRGDPALIGETIRRFIAWRKAHGLPPRRHATFNILHGDPDQVPPEDFRLDLCVATSQVVTEDGSGVVAGLLAGGRCAVLRHVGSDDGLGAAFACLYDQWLPQSGEELRDAPLFLQRVTFFPDVPEHEAVVDIFLPLRQNNQPQV